MVRACLCCGRPLVRSERPGRPANYCSGKCSKRMEKRRALWDRRASMVADPGGFYAINRDEPDRTPEQRQYWQAELDAARATLGPRP
jgi:hypothetical protein